MIQRVKQAAFLKRKFEIFQTKGWRLGCAQLHNVLPDLAMKLEPKEKITLVNIGANKGTNKETHKDYPNLS